MPWTPQTPYVAQLFTHEHEEPEEIFCGDPDQLEREIEKHRNSGLYARIWSGHGASENRNEWQQIAEWERGD